MSNLLKKEKGFTLIEIVLVLAIAGLLLVIVFLAVSGAQKSRRDTQRKNDNARLMSQVESCASNHNGDYTSAVPVPACNTVAAYSPATATYAPSNFNDPSTGNVYTVSVGPAPVCTAVTAGQVTLTFAGRIVTSTMCLEQGASTLTNK